MKSLSGLQLLSVTIPQEMTFEMCFALKSFFWDDFTLWGKKCHQNKTLHGEKEGLRGQEVWFTRDSEDGQTK